MFLTEKKEVLLVIAVLAGLLIYGNHNTITGQVSKSYSCQDTDGVSVLTKGITTSGQGANIEKTYTDFCLVEDKTGGLVHEYWCDAKTLKEENLDCPPSYSCSDGKCIQTTNNKLIPEEVQTGNYYCQDSDGLSTLTKGTATYKNSGHTEKQVTDYCLGEGKEAGLIREYWCSEKTIRQSNFACSYNQKCVDGKCI